MALLIIGTMSTPARGTVAYLASAMTASGSTFTAGQVKLTHDLGSSSLVTFSNIYPGKDVYGGLTVTNAGNVDLRYSVTSQATTCTPDCALAGALNLVIKARNSGGTAACDATGFDSADYGTSPMYPPSGTAPIATADGLVTKL